MELNTSMKIPVHVEVAVKESCNIKFSDLTVKIKDYLRMYVPIYVHGEINLNHDNNLKDNIEYMRINDLGSRSISYWQAEILIHLIQFSGITYRKYENMFALMSTLSGCQNKSLKKIF
jgi:hypothetical protein